MRLRPAPGVVVSDDVWESPGWQVRLPAPPQLIGSHSTRHDREAAQAVLRIGMASSTPTSRGPGPFAVDLVSAHPLPSSVRGAALRVCVLMVRAHPFITASVTLVPMAAFLSGFVLIAWAGVCALIVAASFVVHEVGHAVAFRILAGAGAPMTLRITPLAAGLVWRSTGSTARDRAIIVAGPIAPLIVAVPVVLLAQGDLVVLFASFITAASHLISLALPEGDGRELRELNRPVEGVA
ncbi:hypothetical protein [Microbacterium stercoris]|uniref:DUF3267 domain-containing protein n=1 Tax=Microbacterium stercoris TaxID=2820289 RepID=A0A939TYC6_9MICO|nr:hypothetical protein [Microbacterium stercoris]MBO3664577.1 hypothetical protein [Microbacterium stercoris]